MDPQQFARIVNPKSPEEEGAIEQFFSLDKDELMRQIDILPVGSSITSQREVRTQQIMQAQQILMQMQQLGQVNQPPFNVNMLEVAKMSLEDLDIKNINDILQEMPPQPPAQPAAQGQPPQGQPQPGGAPPPPQGGAPPQPPQMMAGAQAAGGGFPF
jgi:hypothetical protein